jgi:hypothetical protein
MGVLMPLPFFRHDTCMNHEAFPLDCGRRGPLAFCSVLIPLFGQ